MKRYAMLMLLLTTLQCGAAEWQVAAWDAAGNTVSVDTTSVNDDGALRKVFSQWNYKEPQSINGVAFSSTLNFSLFNCKEKSIGIAKMTLFSERFMRGNAGYHVERPESEIAMSKTVEGTVSAKVVDYVCALPPAKKD